MSKAFTFSLKRSCFDENYNPSENTRTTTNFANLARGEKRQENLRNTLVMINNRFNDLRNQLGAVRNPTKERIFIRADKDVLYGDFMGVMNMLQDHGFYSVALVGEDK